MVDYYTLSYDHTAVVANAPVFVYKWVKISPSQMLEGGRYFRQIPTLAGGEVLETEISGTTLYLKNHGPGTLCELTPKELMDYIIKKTFS